MSGTSSIKIWRKKRDVEGLLGKQGVVLSYTVVRTPPRSYHELAPYPVALVKLSGGKRLVSQLVDCAASDVKIGMKVVVVLRRLRHPDSSEVIPYGVKFKPL